MRSEDDLAELAVEAISKSGKRGIINGMGKPANLPENIIAIDSIPHSWLFKAGVPSIIIPFSNDQFAWAHRSYDLGVGAKPLSKKELTADKLADAINFALSDEVVANAKALGKKIATENGAMECAKIVVKCLEG